MDANSPRIEDPFRREKRIIPPRARKLASLQREPASTTPVATVPEEAVENSDPILAITAAAPPPAEEPVQAPAPEMARPVRQIPPKPREKRASGNNFAQAVVITLVALAFVGYAFNIDNLQTLADGLVSRLNLTAQTQGTTFAPILAKALPYLILLPLLLLLYAVLMTVASILGFRSKRKSPRKSSRGPREDFRLIADERGVRARVAYQTFLLLEPLLPEGHTLDVSDRLEDDLGLTPEQIRTVRLALLEKTLRQVDPAAPLTHVSTVLGMMVSAQHAPSREREPQAPVYLPGDPSRKRA